MALSKVFVLGLPRTGTTSVCASLLDMGFTVAHTAYTQAAFGRADAIADTPLYSDYREIHSLFPDARWVYLERSKEQWLPSMRLLLEKLRAAEARGDGLVHPLLRRCIANVFAPIDDARLLESDFLAEAFDRHHSAVHAFFGECGGPSLSIDIARPESYRALQTFLDCENSEEGASFPHLNRDGKITAWQKIRHPLKVDSHAAGEFGRKYFNY